MRREVEAVVVAAAGIGLGLVRPGWDGTIEDRVVATCWAAAAGLWAWLTVVGGLHAWATRTGRVRLRRVSGALLPVGVRRRVEQLALAGLLVVPAAACAGGAEPAAPVLVLEGTTPVAGPDGPPPDVHAAPTTPTPPSTAPGTSTTTTLPPPVTTPPATAATTTTTTTTTTTPPPSTAAPDPDGPDPAEDPVLVVPVEEGTRVVLRGDSLWSIAAEHVADGGGSADAGRTHRYWVALVEENRATLASGDPDVIFPGEVVRLPPLLP